MGFFDNFKEKAADLAQAGVAQSKRLAEIAKLKTANTVSYTHLDVYKRQAPDAHRGDQRAGRGGLPADCRAGPHPAGEPGAPSKHPNCAHRALSRLSYRWAGPVSYTHLKIVKGAPGAPSPHQREGVSAMAARRRSTTVYNTYGSVAYAPAYDGSAVRAPKMCIRDRYICHVGTPPGRLSLK